MTPTEARKAEAARLAVVISVDADDLFAAAMAIWSNLNPQTVTFVTALSASAAALAAVKAGHDAARAAEPDAPPWETPEWALLMTPRERAIVIVAAETVPNPAPAEIRVQDCRLWRRGVPAFANDRRGTTEERREWAALDRVAQTKLANLVRERSAKGTDELTEAIAPLLEIARKLPMAADRDAFAAYVLRRINNVWHESPSTPSTNASIAVLRCSR
jgi:hypothetical protein